GADDVDPRVLEDLDILPALRAGGAGRVRVRQLVDEDDRRLSSKDRVGIHLFDDDAAVFDPAARDHLEAADELLRFGPAMRLDVADDQIRPAIDPAMPLFEHPERLADARRHADVDAEPPTVVRDRPTPARPREHLLGGRAIVAIELAAHVVAFRSPSR